MAKQPCIRGIQAFRKGCPMRPWNGEDGCPAWIEMEMQDKSGNRVLIKECLDLYMARLHYSTNALLEGNQQAVESFRNNMTTAKGPKPDPAVLRLLQVVEEINSLPKQIGH